MRSPIDWLKQRRVKEAVRNYPIYSPPNKQEERTLPDSAVAENFEYFLRTRHQRTTFLRDWLREHFRVSTFPEEPDAAPILVWLSRYGEQLLNATPWNSSFYTYDPPWTDEFAGYNVLFDVGTVIGESVVRQSVNVEWATDWATSRYRDEELQSLKGEDLESLRGLERYWKHELRKQASGIRRPILLHRFNPLWTFWPHLEVRSFCEFLRPKEQGDFAIPENYEDPAPQVLAAFSRDR
jgi:hypothetical protein